MNKYENIWAVVKTPFSFLVRLGIFLNWYTFCVNRLLFPSKYHQKAEKQKVEAHNQPPNTIKVKENVEKYTKLIAPIKKSYKMIPISRIKSQPLNIYKQL